MKIDKIALGIFSLVLMTTMLSGCKKESNLIADPNGTITVSINDANNMFIYEGLAEKQYAQYPYLIIAMAITTSTLNTNFAMTACPDATNPHGSNFYNTGGEAANIGAVNGLGEVTTKPTTGYSVRSTFEKGHGYVVRYRKSYDQTDTSLDYYYGRFYVVDWLRSATTGGVIGVTIKYQGPF
jgi:hypothetical protein